MHSILVAVNHYCQMWPQDKQIHSSLPSKSEKNIMLDHQNGHAFKHMKALMAQDCLLAYLNHSIPMLLQSNHSKKGCYKSLYGSFPLYLMYTRFFI